MDYLLPIFYFTIFPGFLFTAIVGLLANWVDRKVSAMVQWRVGPPWYQPAMDGAKLMGKEIIVPAGASKSIFLLAPILSLVAVTLSSTLILRAALSPGKGFGGDLIVIFYLLAIPSLSIILGGMASRNPLASIGAGREMKLILSYELPFILVLLVPIIKAGGTIRLGEIIAFQTAQGMIADQLSGIIALLAAILCMQAKLALPPFDIPEAETEIIAGPFTEYSGVALGVFNLSRAMSLFVGPAFLVVTLMGGIGSGPGSTLLGILKYVGLLVIIILIKNTNPRIRIDQAIRFFWGKVSIVAAIAVGLALLGW
ncbi:MAG: NADH-quinone oxidoreductase subunit H [bacterium]|nr:NADH-quinone oxidoreductase subunit H [bacterium]